MSERLPDGQSPIEILCRASEFGLTLGVNPSNNKLTVDPVERCPKEFLETLREAKPWLLVMLRWPFVMVHSKALETLFFCNDNPTREWLIDAGASEWSIYTKDELRVLCEANRVAPLSADELRMVHEIKRTFSGRITK